MYFLAYLLAKLRVYLSALPCGSSKSNVGLFALINEIPVEIRLVISTTESIVERYRIKTRRITNPHREEKSLM